MSDDAIIRDVSDTAIWVAYYRGLESTRANPVFRDPLALILAGERGREIAKTMPYRQIMEWVMVVRTSAIDGFVMKAISEGVDTVLNLGAGLDTRPYRMDLPKDLRWIEVDFPQIINYKNQKLKDEKPRCHLERVIMDLSKRDERKKFFAQVATQSKKVLVITEGVIPYLSTEDVTSLANDLYEYPQFDFWLQDYYMNQGARNRMPRAWRKKLSAAPFKFKAPNWFEFFSPLGWKSWAQVTTSDEGDRLKIKPPFIFPLSLFFVLMSKTRREKFRKMSGYVLMRRSDARATQATDSRSST